MPNNIYINLKSRPPVMPTEKPADENNMYKLDAKAFKEMVTITNTKAPSAAPPPPPEREPEQSYYCGGGSVVPSAVVLLPMILVFLVYFVFVSDNL